MRELVRPDFLARRNVPRLQLADVRRRRLRLTEVELVGVGPEPQLTFNQRLLLADHRATQVVVRRDVEKPGRRAVGGRWPILAAPQRRTERYRFAHGGDFCRVVLGSAGLRIDLGEDILVDERVGGDEIDLVRAALEQPEVSIATRMDQALDVAAANSEVGQDRRIDFIPVPCIVVVILVMIFDLARVGIDGDDRAGVEIVAGMRIAGPGRSITDAPVSKIELRIIVSGEPYRPAAVLPVIALPSVMTRLAGTRNSCRSATTPCRPAHRRRPQSPVRPAHRRKRRPGPCP